MSRELEAKLARLQARHARQFTVEAALVDCILTDTPPPSKPKSTLKNAAVSPAAKGARASGLLAAGAMSASRSDPPDGMSSVQARPLAGRRSQHPGSVGQVWIFPRSRPSSSNISGHRLVCSCGCSNSRQNSPVMRPPGQAGPRLIAFAASLDGVLSSVEAESAQFMSMVLNQPASPACGWHCLQTYAEAAPSLAATTNWLGRLPEEAAPRHRRIADEGGPGQSMGLDLRRRELHVLSSAAPAAGPTFFQELLDRRFLPALIHCDRAPHVLELRPTAIVAVLGSISNATSKLSSTVPAARTNGSATISSGPRKSCSRCGNESATARCLFRSGRSRTGDETDSPRDRRAAGAATATRRHTASVKNWSNTQDNSGPSWTSKESESRRMANAAERSALRRPLSSGVSCLFGT